MKNQEPKLEIRVVTEPTLKEAQEFVGGFVEVVNIRRGDILLINEEGKLNNLPINFKATDLIDFPDYIVGNAMLISSEIRKNW